MIGNLSLDELAFWHRQAMESEDRRSGAVIRDVASAISDGLKTKRGSS